MAQSLKPYESISRAVPRPKSWMRRRTFLGLMKKAVGLSGLDISPRVTIRQLAEGGLKIEALAGAATARVPFEVHATSTGATVSPGVVIIPGSPNAYHLGPTTLGGGGGFVVIRARLALPQWTVGSDTDFTGWVVVDEPPTLMLQSEPEAMACQCTFGPGLACDPIYLSFPLAYVEPRTRGVTQLATGTVNVGFRRPGTSMWPDLIFSLS